MKKLLMSIVMGLFMGGCSSTPVGGEATSKIATDSTPSANLATLGAVTTVPPSVTVATEAATVSSRPMAVTVRPPVIPVAPIQGTPPVGVVSTPFAKPLAGWQTFTSPILGIAIDYPSGWAVTQQPEGAAFASPQGQVLLQVIKANVMSGGNQQCATLITSYGLTADTCVDTASHIYSATFALGLANGSTEWLRLSTMDQEALDVYLQMLDSLRLK